MDGFGVMVMVILGFCECMLLSVVWWLYVMKIGRLRLFV